jgi:DNA-binding transcriptional regulator YbjK
MVPGDGNRRLNDLGVKMKKLILVLVLGALLGGSAMAACTADDVALAQKFLSDMKDREQAGQVTSIDVKIAQCSVYDMEYCAGTITRAAYCKEKTATVQAMLEQSRTRLDQGFGSAAEYARALEQLAKVRTLCN